MPCISVCFSIIVTIERVLMFMYRCYCLHCFVIDTSTSLSENQCVSLEKLLKEATDASQGFSTQHKDSHGAISRMGKAIDRVSLAVC